ncbi:MAG: type IV secretion system DNA-binding domain-containing protein [Solirubrobacterales bacterium]
MKESLTRNQAPQLPALHNLNGVAHLLTTGLVCLVIAALLGFLTAHYLRHHQYAWTWGSIALAPLPFLVLLIGTGFLTFAAAVISLSLVLGAAGGALGWGAHTRVEDRRAGGDREIAATQRRGLLDAPRRHLVERGKRSERALSEGLPVGRTNRNELAMIARGSARSGSHSLVCGGTGAGKTTSLAAFLAEYVARSGFGAVVLEAKADRTLLDAAQAAAAQRGTRFHLLSPDGPSTYDPLAHGSVDERSERLIAVESWGSSDAGFYRQASSPYLRMVLRTLDSSTRRVTLSTVAHFCQADELQNLASQCEDAELVAEVSMTCNGLRSDQQRAIAGLTARLQNLASSEFARNWLDPEKSGVEVFDLRTAIERCEVVYLRFDTDRTGNVGRAIAQMALLDLGAVASALMNEGVGTFVAIDEFGALEAPAIDRLYTRGRAAGFSVAVGTQTLADLRAAGPAVRERIGATISSIVCHRLGEQADAEWVAQLIGTVPTWESTIRTDRFGRATSDGTRSRGYRFEVNPSELQRLRAGEAFVARLDETGNTRAHRARVFPPWLRLPNMAMPT